MGADSTYLSLAGMAVNVAREELHRGVFETSNDNRGDRIDEYEQVFGLVGESWCLAFVYWCYNQAAARLGVKNPLPRVALVQALLTWASKEQKLVAAPQAGDVLIVKPAKHAGLVVGAALSTGQVPSIEGNTWAGTTKADRKEGVYELKKETLSGCVFVRP